MFVILWEYEVKPGKALGFERVHGPEGPWVALFQTDPHYRQTHLFKDSHRDNIYLTLDFWNSETDYSHFKQNRKLEYEELDQRTEDLTISERRLGSFLQNA